VMAHVNNAARTQSIQFPGGGDALGRFFLAVFVSDANLKGARVPRDTVPWLYKRHFSVDPRQVGNPQRW
jgi:hypothetical protein